MKEAVDYIRNKGNVFMTEINEQMRNLVTEEHIPTETIQKIDIRYTNRTNKLFDR